MWSCFRLLCRKAIRWLTWMCSTSIMVGAQWQWFSGTIDCQCTSWSPTPIYEKRSGKLPTMINSQTNVMFRVENENKVPSSSVLPIVGTNESQWSGMPWRTHPHQKQLAHLQPFLAVRVSGNWWTSMHRLNEEPMHARETSNGITWIVSKISNSTARTW